MSKPKANPQASLVKVRQATPSEEAQVSKWLEGLGEDDNFAERLEHMPEGRVKSLIYARLVTWRAGLKELTEIRRATILMDMFSGDPEVRANAVRMAQAEEKLSGEGRGATPPTPGGVELDRIKAIEAGLDDDQEETEEDK